MATTLPLPSPQRASKSRAWPLWRDLPCCLAELIPHRVPAGYPFCLWRHVALESRCRVDLLASSLRPLSLRTTTTGVVTGASAANRGRYQAPCLLPPTKFLCAPAHARRLPLCCVQLRNTARLRPSCPPPLPLSNPPGHSTFCNHPCALDGVMPA